MIKIALDALGGDNSPLVNVEGAINAVNEIKDLTLYVFGDENKINEILSGYDYDKERLKVVHAPDEITCNDKPTDAIRFKKDSSLVKAIDTMKQDEEIGGLVSVGSTGAVLSGAVLKLGRIRGVKRPALCPILPTVNGKIVAICDSGANAECDEEQLVQFAIMSSLYMKKAFSVENPKIALLNIGAEKEKGDELRKSVYKRLKEIKDINFVGNMEARELLTGVCDVVVCDGFSGNVLLKSTEGACLELLGLVKKAFYKNAKTKIGALLVKKEVKAIKNLMDYNNYGGAVLLGCNKTVVKGHGNSKSKAIYNCIKQAYEMEKSKLRTYILDAFNQTL